MSLGLPWWILIVPAAAVVWLVWEFWRAPLIDDVQDDDRETGALS